jgi:hypothetical protein
VARQPAFARRLAGRRKHGLGQAGEVPIAKLERIGLFVGEEVLTELSAEHGEPLADSGQPLLDVDGTAGARARKTALVALEDAALLGIEVEFVAPRPEIVDATKQVVVEVEPVSVAREHRSHLALYPLQHIVRVRAGQVEEHARDAPQQRPGLLQGDDRVVEGGRLLTLRDRVRLGEVFGEASLEGVTEMICLDHVEGRNLERSGPRLQEWIGSRRRFEAQGVRPGLLSPSVRTVAEPGQWGESAGARFTTSDAKRPPVGGRC